MSEMKMIITIRNMPKDVTHNEIRQYIRDALETHGGGLRPSDPFFLGLKTHVSNMHVLKRRK